MKLEKISYYYLSKHGKGLGKTKTNSVILLCRKCKNERIVEKYELILFKSMGRIIVRNIDNFFFLIRNCDKICLYSKEDLIGECYLILNRCIHSNFDVKSGKDFFWYYNTSLTRGLKRILDNNYLLHIKTDNVENLGSIKIPEDSKEDFFDYYCKILNFTDKEQQILKSKVDQIKIKDFVKTSGINENEYYRLLNSIKEKSKKIKHELIN